MANRPAAPTVSVVIPVYNEASVIDACLGALTAQTRQADEIVVIDNNSTDDTVALAEKYRGVRVLREERQGISFARQTGFDAVQDGIIARIDADTLVAPDWIDSIHREFEKGDVDALAGGAGVRELSPRGRFWGAWYYRLFRAWHERSIGVRPMMYGFNSALTVDAWKKIRELVTVDDQTVSEDVDVTISLLKTGHRIRFAPSLRVTCRVIRSWNAPKLTQYYRTDSLTLAKHEYGNPKRRANPSS